MWLIAEHHSWFEQAELPTLAMFGRWGQLATVEAMSLL